MFDWQFASILNTFFTIRKVYWYWHWSSFKESKPTKGRYKYDPIYPLVAKKILLWHTTTTTTTTTTNNNNNNNTTNTTTTTQTSNRNLEHLNFQKKSVWRNLEKVSWPVLKRFEKLVLTLPTWTGEFQRWQGQQNASVKGNMQTVSLFKTTLYFVLCSR